jgi:IS30 family transposase
MAPKKVTNVEKPKRKIIMTAVELKKELITKWEEGTRVSDLAVQYGMAKSTISTTLKNREAIKAAYVAKGVKSLTSKRRPAVEEVNVRTILCIQY